MTPDINPAEHPAGLGVLLHPHPGYGGNRFHPFVDGLFRRLPDVSVSAVRFDFSAGEVGRAREEALEATEAARREWPGLPVALVGYSFGAAVAASLPGVGPEGPVAGRPFAGWFLLAPPLALLDGAVIGDRPEPKSVWVPEHDQFSPPAAVGAALAGWTNTEVSVVPGADHFLGSVSVVVAAAVRWATRLFGT